MVEGGGIPCRRVARPMQARGGSRCEGEGRRRAAAPFLSRAACIVAPQTGSCTLLAAMHTAYLTLTLTQPLTQPMHSWQPNVARGGRHRLRLSRCPPDEKLHLLPHRAASIPRLQIRLRRADDDGAGEKAAVCVERLRVASRDAGSVRLRRRQSTRAVCVRAGSRWP